MEQLSERGACYNCGFLSRKDVLNTHLTLFYEISEEDRTNGHFFPFSSLGAPRCFRGVDVGGEIRDSTGLPDYPIRTEEHQQRQNAAGKKVLEAARECELWFPYTPGMSPKEHLEEYKMLQLEQERRGWQEPLLKMQQDLSRRPTKREFWLGVAVLIATLLVATPDSVLWNLMRWGWRVVMALVGNE